MISPSRRPATKRDAAAGGLERLSKAERRDQLLDTAAALVSEQGFEAVTMERVAATAGVSKALPYNHFDNAETLLMALRDREMAALTQRVVAGVLAADGFEGQVAAAVHAWFDVAKYRGSTLTTFLRWLPQFEAAVHAQPAPETPFDWFLAELFQREVGMPKAQARVAQRFCVMGMVGALDAWTEGHAPQAAIEEQTARMILAGVRALGKPARGRVRST